MGITDIEGYEQFQRDTDKIEKELEQQGPSAAQEFARQWIAFAQSNVSTSQQQVAAQTFHVMTEAEGAEITNPSPLFFGSEFGGQGRPETMHFPPHNGRRGYWFYPARRNNEDQLNMVWDKGVQIAMRHWNHRE